MLRLVDANLNRAREGLRLLEDVARFVLNDAALSQRLKNLRHQLAQATAQLQLPLLTARDTAADVGIGMRPSSEMGRPDLAALVSANARRVEESLRVLEEATRSPGFEGVDWQIFQAARFAIYDIEKQLLSGALRQAGRQRVKGLYLVLDTEWLNGRTEAEVVRQAIRGGASMVQLRDKRRCMRDLLPVAQELKLLCQASGAMFVVNDHVDIALAVGAECLHLGQTDLPLNVARGLLPVGVMLGGAARTVEQAEQAERQGADYVAVGSMYPTRSKHDTVVVGPEMLRRVREKMQAPLVAIGGINKDNVAAVVSAGADAIAVISAVMATDDVERAAREMVNAIEKSKEAGQNKAPHG